MYWLFVPHAKSDWSHVGSRAEGLCTVCLGQPVKVVIQKTFLWPLLKLCVAWKVAHL